MFKKASKYPQTDLLSSVEQHLDGRRRKALHDPDGWQNSFYREIFVQIDESVFKPIYHDRMGAPNAPVNQLVAMMILKDGMGLSDEQLFEACRFHLLYRQALGCVNLSDSIPTESTYYKFRSDVEAYQRAHDIDLFGQVFQKITSDQVIRFSLSGKQIRMDSKLIGSNIAFYSRFQLVHATMMLFYSDLSEQAITEMPDELARQMQQMTDEDAESMVHHSSSEQIKNTFADLGRRIQQLLDCYSTAHSRHHERLKRVFNEQFTVGSDSESGDNGGDIISRPATDIPADSVQSPHDPECSYRRKAGKQTKGYSLNVTETIEDDQLNLITDIQLEPAHWGDADFVDPSIAQTEKLTGDQVDTCYADGAYNRSIEHEADDQTAHVEMVLSGIQGSPSRFELDETSDGVEVTDTQTGQVYQGIPVRRRDPDAAPGWRITLKDGTYRSFGQREIRASSQRRKLAGQAHQKRIRRRNNVEASIYHLAHRLKQSKTVYRGLSRTKIWAWGRALWVNMRRIQRNQQEHTPAAVIHRQCIPKIIAQAA